MTMDRPAGAHRVTGEDASKENFTLTKWRFISILRLCGWLRSYFWSFSRSRSSPRWRRSRS